MTDALPPAQAAAYVRELSADVRAVAVLDGAGTPLAGPSAFAAAAVDLLAACDGGELVVRTDAGVVFAARAADGAVVAVAGPMSLLGPTALDVRAALAALTGAPAANDVPPTPSTPADPALRRAIAALLAVA